MGSRKTARELFEEAVKKQNEINFADIRLVYGPSGDRIPSEWDAEGLEEAHFEFHHAPYNVLLYDEPWPCCTLTARLNEPWHIRANENPGFLFGVLARLNEGASAVLAPGMGGDGKVITIRGVAQTFVLHDDASIALGHALLNTLESYEYLRLVRKTPQSVADFWSSIPAKRLSSVSAEAERYPAERYQVYVEFKVPADMSTQQVAALFGRLECAVSLAKPDASYDADTRTKDAAWYFTESEDAIATATRLRAAADADDELRAMLVTVHDCEADKCLWVNGDTA